MGDLMPMRQAAATLQGPYQQYGLKRGRLSNLGALRMAMSLGQANALSQAALLAPSYRIQAEGDQRAMNALLNAYGNKAQMGAAQVTPTGQIMKSAGITQERMANKAITRARGIEGRLRSGKGRPQSVGPGSYGISLGDLGGMPEGMSISTGGPSIVDPSGTSPEILDALREMGVIGGDAPSGANDFGGAEYDDPGPSDFGGWDGE